MGGGERTAEAKCGLKEEDGMFPVAFVNRQGDVVYGAAPNAADDWMRDVISFYVSQGVIKCGSSSCFPTNFGETLDQLEAIKLAVDLAMDHFGKEN